MFPIRKHSNNIIHNKKIDNNKIFNKADDVVPLQKMNEKSFNLLIDYRISKPVAERLSTKEPGVIEGAIKIVEEAKKKGKLKATPQAFLVWLLDNNIVTISIDDTSRDNYEKEEKEMITTLSLDKLPKREEVSRYIEKIKSELSYS